MMPSVVETVRAPRSRSPLSQAIRLDHLLFVSGQVATEPATGKVTAGGIREHANQAISNLAAVLEAGGASLATVVKTTCFLADINDFEAFNEIYAQFFTDQRPARSTLQTGLVGGALVEIEAIAYIP